MKELEDIWKESRWIMDLISVAREKPSPSSSTSMSSNRVILFKELEIFFEEITKSAIYPSLHATYNTPGSNDLLLLNELIDRRISHRLKKSLHFENFASMSESCEDLNELMAAGKYHHHHHHRSSSRVLSSYFELKSDVFSHKYFHYHHIDSISVDDDETDLINRYKHRLSFHRP